MTSSETMIFVFLVVMALPFAVWRILGGRQTLPLVVVQILCGIALGPAILGQFAPTFHAAIFSPDIIKGLNAVALLAVMIFVFFAGVELNLRAAWFERRDTGITAGLALVVPFAAGALAGLILFQWQGWLGPKAALWQGALGLGTACAVTALPILVLFLKQLGLMHQALGQRVLRYASLDDIAIWAVLALILSDFQRLGRQAIFAVIFIAAAYAMRKLMPRLSQGNRWPIALIWMLTCALITDWAGLHYIVGAFLAGAVLESEWLGHDEIDRYSAFTLTALMPIFFLATGLRTSWEVGGMAVVGAAGLLLLAAVGGKLAGVAMAGRILNWPKGDAWGIGWLLQTKALIMIIFSNVLHDKGLISGATFTALLLMAVASTVLTMPIVTRWLSAR